MGCARLRLHARLHGDARCPLSALRLPMSLGRRVASATGLLTASSMLVRLLSLLTLPILTRLLDPQAYGNAALVGTAIALLGVVALLGLDMSYARAYHSTDGPGAAKVEHFVWRVALVAAMATGILGAIGWWLLAPRIDARAEYGAFILVGVVLSVAQTMSQTKARLENRYRGMAFSLVASGVFSALLAIAVAWWWRNDAYALLLSMLGGYLVVVAALGFPSVGTLFAPAQMKASEKRAILGIGLAGSITAPMFWVLSSLDRWFLGAMEGTAAAGIYSVGYNLSIFGTMVSGAISAVWLPEASRLFEANRESARDQLGALMEKLIVLLAIVWLAVVAAGGDALRLLAAPAFHSAAAVVPFIAGAIFFNGVLQLANAGNLLARQLHLTLAWWLAGALLCVVMNLLLIPRWGMLGAAITQTCCFALVATGIWIQAQRGFRLNLRSGRLLGLPAPSSACRY